MSSNNQSNAIIKWLVILADFVILNAVIYAFTKFHPQLQGWAVDKLNLFVLICNMAMVMSEARFSTIIHERLVSSADVLRRIVLLTLLQTVLSYLIWKVIDLRMPVGWLLLEIGTCLFVLVLLARFIERTVVKRYRRAGRNTRMVTFVGDDPELENVYEKLMKDSSLGYRLTGWWKNSPDSSQGGEGARPDGHADGRAEYKGSVADLLSLMESGEELQVGDEMYVCLSRRDRDTVRRLSRYCDKNVVRFYFVPVSVETLGMDLKREMMDDMEVYTTYENPLLNPVNKTVKRAFDIVLSGLFLLFLLPLLPVIALIIKIQSPGPVFFRQLRTGIDGKEFYCYKFRSMHVNKDADKVQATKDDPRKFAFGNFMRKMNIDELPQFWNVLKGNMSIVGPRPHMLAHTEQYSALIDKYMVRHFVKPGVTGWAQVTGFRGETKELWQMEGRVKRDIWYMEHWSLWLDLRIIWLTAKTMVVHDKNAY